MTLRGNRTHAVRSTAHGTSRTQPQFEPQNSVRARLGRRVSRSRRAEYYAADRCCQTGPTAGWTRGGGLRV